jgi:DNA-directed RNA polymerase specialized sigma24 family protein
MTQVFIIEKYGPRLSMDQLADLMGVARNTLYNRISKGTLNIKTYVEGGRWCDYRDAAAYFDSCRESAAIPA